MSEEQKSENTEKIVCCDVCGKSGAKQRCSGCHVAVYCSKECQKIDWQRGHRHRCPVAQYPDVQLVTKLSDDAEHRVLAARDFEAGELMFAEMPVLSAPLEPQKRLLNGTSKQVIDEEARNSEARFEGLLMRNLLSMHSENVIPIEQMIFVPQGTVTTWTLVNLFAVYLASASLYQKKMSQKKDKTEGKQDETNPASVGCGPACDAVDALMLPAASSLSSSSRWGILRGLAADVIKLPQVQDVLCGSIESAQTLITRVEQLLTRLDCRHIVCREGPIAALYARTCFIRHSCAPNCVFTTRRDGAIFFRAVRPIKSGEEITVSFLDDMQMMWPTKRRRECLLELKYFECKCPRCLRPDYTCAIKCPLCKKETVMPTDLLLQPIPEEMPKSQREEYARRVAGTPCWKCQNKEENCQGAFTAEVAPFGDVFDVMAATLTIEQKLEQRSPAKSGEAEAFLAEIDKQIAICSEKLGKRHWAYAQLTYARMIELQSQAVRKKEESERKALEKSVAQAAQNFFEWVVNTVGDDCISLVANTGYVTAQMCQRCPDFEEYATEVLAKIYPLYAAVHGRDNADTVLIADSLKAKSPKSSSESK